MGAIVLACLDPLGEAVGDPSFTVLLSNPERSGVCGVLNAAQLRGGAAEAGDEGNAPILAIVGETNREPIAPHSAMAKRRLRQRSKAKRHSESRSSSLRAH